MLEYFIHYALVEYYWHLPQFRVIVNLWLGNRYHK